MERNRDGLIPGQQVDLATIKRIEREKRERQETAGAAAPVDFSEPWFTVRAQVEQATGVRPKNKTHARELMGFDDAGTKEQTDADAATE